MHLVACAFGQYKGSGTAVRVLFLGWVAKRLVRGRLTFWGGTKSTVGAARAPQQAAPWAKSSHRKLFLLRRTNYFCSSIPPAARATTHILNPLTISSSLHHSDSLVIDESSNIALYCCKPPVDSCSSAPLIANSCFRCPNPVS